MAWHLSVVFVALCDIWVIIGWDFHSAVYRLKYPIASSRRSMAKEDRVTAFFFFFFRASIKMTR